MAKFKNTVWDSTAGAYVAWLSDDDYDAAGASYPGPGTFGVHTSQYRRGEIYDAVIASATDSTAVHIDVSAEIDGVAEKGSPVSGDFLLIEDSAASLVKKKVQVGSLPGGSGTDADAIHDNVASEISAITAKATPTTSDFLVIEDAADSNNKKSITVGDLPAAAPASHASTHNAGGGDALAIDAAAGTGSLRTLGTSSTAACAGDDSRLSDSRTPTTHASTHQSGGGDAIKLDDLASPDDNTDLDATISAHGLLPKLGGGTTNYLRADGTWAAPPGGTDADAIHDNVAGEIVLITEKGTPVSADLLIIEDSGDSNNKKRVQVGNLPGGSGTDADAIHDNVAAEISAITAKATPTTSDYLIIEDSADSDNKKAITIGDLPAAAPASHASTHDAGGGDALAIDAVAGTGSLRTLGTSSTAACAGDDSRLSDNRTDATAIHTDGSTEISGLTEKASPVSADVVVIEDSEATYGKKKVQVGNLGGGGGGGDATSLQGDDIDPAISPTDGQVLTWDNGSSHWTASSPAEHTSYRELATNTLDTQGISVVENDVGEGVFDAAQHNSVTFRATLTASWASTGTLEVKLYDDGPTAAPGTPRLVSTFSKTTDGGYEVFEQALTIVASGASTNEILGEARVYRVTIEVDGTTGDTGYIGSAGLVGVGNGSAVTLNADLVQAIAMSLNA